MKYVINLSVLFLFLTSAALADGKTLYEENCKTCHTIGAESNEMAPDLAGIFQKRDEEFIRRFLREPDKLFEEKNETVMKLLEEYDGFKMPNPGLDDSQINKIMKYLRKATKIEKEKRETEKTSIGEKKKISEKKKAESAFSNGDADKGKKLFLGEMRFKNGAPPCFGCHSFSIQNETSVRGGNLGPNISRIVSKTDKSQLYNLFGNFPYRIMKPIYTDRKLTENEKKHLIAFFKEESSEAKDGKRLNFSPVRFVGMSTVVFILITVFIPLYWKNRL